MSKNAPDPTPPRETSAAQTGSSVSTGIANAWLQNMNEVTPDGSRTFDQTGSSSFTDPYTGETYDIPRFTVTQTLNEQQQAIKDRQDDASLNLADLGANLSGTLGDQLTGNFQLGNEATENRLFDLGRQRLDPMFANRDEDLRTRLANQGIKAGSQAYDREMALAGQQQNDAYNQLLLQGRGQANQELLTEDNQRINQISALLNGGQVSQPNFMTGNNINGINATDNAAIIANSDNARMNAWGQNQAAMGSNIGSLGGLFALSDERAKDHKEKIGETKDGLGIYSFKYKGSPKTEIGLMAQEVKKSKPGAVMKRPDGLFAVNYEEALS
ncbi:MAG: tail fiber domain-containing protein [Sulfitobacter sp.]